MSYTPPVIPHLAGLEKPQDLLLKLDHCDILILGTGLVESILAAALSWQGVEVLHIDNKDYYGDLTSTLTIEQLKKWCLEVNQGRIQHFQDAQIYIPGGKTTNRYSSKDYGIDLTAKIMFAQSDLLLLLIKSRVYKYLEFQLVSNFHVFENDNFNKRISSSTKEDIFTDQSLSLVTKRYLMKFLKFVLQDLTDPAKQQLLNENSKTPIQDFLASHFNLETPQINELVFSIGLSAQGSTKTPEAIAKIRRFLVSFDVYGNFPVMVSKYGGPGEISQGFCRSAAVAGTTYKLNTALADFDPEKKIAKFNDGSQVRINEKVIVSPTQVPKFLQSSYEEATKDLKQFNITRLITVVKKDCAEWMSPKESSVVVVFPPKSLPTENEQSVQVIIQNGGSGVCPNGQSIWYSQTCEQDLNKAKEDLEAAYSKMESAILRESCNDLDKVLDETDFVMSAQGTPVLVNSFKIGESMSRFASKESLEVVCKIGYVQKTYINHDMSNLVADKANNVANKVLPDSEDIIFSNMPSSEISYDGVISEARLIFSRVTGSDEDFFEVDFEDDDEDYSSAAAMQANGAGDVSDKPIAAVSGAILNSANLDNDTAIVDSDEEDHSSADHHHQPFGANEMEL